MNTAHRKPFNIKYKAININHEDLKLFCGNVFVSKENQIPINKFRIEGFSHLRNGYENDKYFVYDIVNQDKFIDENPIAAFYKYLDEKVKEKDLGAHYRFSFTRPLTEDEIKKKIVTVKVDPYRVAQIYNVGGGPREHMLKKLLRMNEKGHTVEDVLGELQSCLDRWKEMVEEEKV